MPVQQFEQLVGRPVQAGDDVQIGTVRTIYLDEDNGEPVLVAVQIDGRAVGVPADLASWGADSVTLPFDVEIVRAAPELDEEESVAPEVVEEIQAHFGPEQSQGAEAGTLTRSEEELRVGTTQMERGRARVRKYVIQEEVSRTIPVSHEELRVEREPVSPAEAAAAGSAEIGEDLQEIVLHEEVPVVQKVSVPKERVRIGAETITEQHEVRETLQKERIEGPEEVEGTGR